MRMRVAGWARAIRETSHGEDSRSSTGGVTPETSFPVKIIAPQLPSAASTLPSTSERMRQGPGLRDEEPSGRTACNIRPALAAPAARPPQIISQSNGSLSRCIAENHISGEMNAKMIMPPITPNTGARRPASTEKAIPVATSKIPSPCADRSLNTIGSKATGMIQTTTIIVKASTQAYSNGRWDQNVVNGKTAIPRRVAMTRASQLNPARIHISNEGFSFLHPLPCPIYLVGNSHCYQQVHG